MQDFCKLKISSTLTEVPVKFCLLLMVLYCHGYGIRRFFRLVFANWKNGSRWGFLNHESIIAPPTGVVPFIGHLCLWLMKKVNVFVTHCGQHNWPSIATDILNITEAQTMFHQTFFFG